MAKFIGCRNRYVKSYYFNTVRYYCNCKYITFNYTNNVVSIENYDYRLDTKDGI